MRCRMQLYVVLGIISVFGFFAGVQAFGQECFDYRTSPGFLCDPLTGLEGETSQLANAGESVITLGEYGLCRLDFGESDIPTYSVQAVADVEEIWVNETYIAAKNENGLVLLSVQTLEPLCQIEGLNVTSVAFGDGLLAVSTTSDILLYDVGDPQTPTLLSTTPLTLSTRGITTAEMLIADQVLLLAENHWCGINCRRGSVFSFDISDPTNLQQLDRFVFQPTDSFHSATFATLERTGDSFLVSEYRPYVHGSHGIYGAGFLSRFSLTAEGKILFETTVDLGINTTAQSITLFGDLAVVSFYDSSGYGQSGFGCTAVDLGVSSGSDPLTAQNFPLASPQYAGPTNRPVLAMLTTDDRVGLVKFPDVRESGTQADSRGSDTNYHLAGETDQHTVFTRYSVYYSPFGCWESLSFQYYDFSCIPPAHSSVSIDGSIRRDIGVIVNDVFAVYTSAGVRLAPVYGTTDSIVFTDIPTRREPCAIASMGNYLLVGYEYHGWDIFEVLGESDMALVYSSNEFYCESFLLLDHILFVMKRPDMGHVRATVVDLTSVQTPTHIGNVEFEGTVVRRTADNRIISNSSRHVYCYDVGDPVNPVLVADKDMGFLIADVAQSGDLLYISSPDYGLVVAEVSPMGEIDVVGGNLVGAIDQLDVISGQLICSGDNYREYLLDCSDPLPAELQYFNSTPLSTGVRLDFALRTYGQSADGYQIIARCGGQTWSLPVSTDDGATFTAFDLSETSSGCLIRQYSLVRSDTGEVLDQITTELSGVPTRTPRLTAAPNPFNPETHITFTLPRVAKVQITVHSLDGRRIKTLVDGVCPGGENTVTWHGADEKDRQVASGRYLVRLIAEGKSISRGVTLLK